jgi:ABC-2 type transport system ATP-binding protein
MTNQPAVSLTGVVKRFDQQTAVDGVDLTIRAGARVALLGLNGAGKSTTISMILGLLRPDAGRVEVFGRTPEEAVRAGLVGAMLQSSRIPPRATVADVVRLATRLYDDAAPAAELMEIADLTHLAGRRVERLSGGEVQRVKFAVAAAGRPQLLMLDEPTTAMDVPSRRAFWSRMRDYAATGRTIVYCTHLMDEARDADEIVVMRAGQIVAQSNYDELTRNASAVTVSTSIAVPNAHRLPGFVSVDVRDERTAITTTAPDELVYALAAAGLIRELRIEGGDLDSAFLRLAGDPSATPLEAAR